MQDFNLTIHEYCHEDSTVTVQGKAPHPRDLSVLAERGRKITEKVLLMERLGVLYLTLDGITVHLHDNGEIVVNRVRSIEEAETILFSLFDAP